MYNDADWLVGRELSRPSDDKFLRTVVEILFAERKRIQAMKELGDFFNPDLDRICVCGPLSVHILSNLEPKDCDCRSKH
jgi:hypothetical protein